MPKPPTHGGKRKGAGRKPALLPYFLKKLRATDAERKELERRLTGDSRLDFILILAGLRSIKKTELDRILDNQ